MLDEIRLIVLYNRQFRQNVGIRVIPRSSRMWGSSGAMAGLFSSQLLCILYSTVECRASVERPLLTQSSVTPQSIGDLNKRGLEVYQHG